MRTVFCVGMRRSASTRQYNVTRDLLKNEVDFEDMGWTIWQDFPRRHMAVEADIALLKTHPFLPHFSQYARDIINHGDNKVLCTFRDARDIAASLYKFEGRLDDTGWTNAIRDVKGAMREFDHWSACPNALIQRYEDGWSAKTIEEIADYLNLSPSEETIRTLWERWSSANVAGMLPDEGFDRNTLFWHKHLQDGRIGKWRDVFNKKQREELNDICADWLERNGYHL